jgi:hypothetical protein
MDKLSFKACTHNKALYSNSESSNRHLWDTGSSASQAAAAASGGSGAAASPSISGSPSRSSVPSSQESDNAAESVEEIAKNQCGYGVTELENDQYGYNYKCKVGHKMYDAVTKYVVPMIMQDQNDPAHPNVTCTVFDEVGTNLFCRPANIVQGILDRVSQEGGENDKAAVVDMILDGTFPNDNHNYPPPPPRVQIYKAIFNCEDGYAWTEEKKPDIKIVLQEVHKVSNINNNRR